MRGKIVNVLNRMPMGLSHAPRIAQAVVNSIVEDIGVALVVNFVFGAASTLDFERQRARLRERLFNYEIEVDDLDMCLSTLDWEWFRDLRGSDIACKSASTFIRFSPHRDQCGGVCRWYSGSSRPSATLAGIHRPCPRD